MKKVVLLLSLIGMFVFQGCAGPEGPMGPKGNPGEDGLISSVFFGADVSDAKKTWGKVATMLLEEVLSRSIE